MMPTLRSKDCYRTCVAEVHKFSGEIVGTPPDLDSASGFWAPGRENFTPFGIVCLLLPGGRK